jgi:hypothetical protein
MATGAVSLPFSLPCAVASKDASIVYSALRSRDKDALMALLAEKRLFMVHQGSSIVVSTAGEIQIVGARTGIGACYVSPEMLPALSRAAS